MESNQHVDLITFDNPRATLPSVILGDAHVYVSMCVPLHVCILHTEIQSYTLCTATLTQYPINARSFNKKNYKTSVACLN